jgi:hypothetical protein
LLQTQPADENAMTTWRETTSDLIVRAFGSEHRLVLEFHSVGIQNVYRQMSDTDFAAASTRERLPIIDSAIQQLEDRVAEAEAETSPGGDITVSAGVLLLAGMARRFGDYARRLHVRQRGRTPVACSDEYDMQDLFEAALRLHFDDVRPEEVTPSYAGGSARMDFLVADEQIGVELKFVHDGDKSRDVGSEIAEDILRYSAHPRCKALIILVWDEGHILVNPRGLERDLTRQHEGLSVTMIVAH